MAALMLATTSAAADDYHMLYTVSMDTAKHYLNVNLTCRIIGDRYIDPGVIGTGTLVRWFIANQWYLSL